MMEEVSLSDDDEVVDGKGKSILDSKSLAFLLGCPEAEEFKRELLPCCDNGCS